MEFGYYRVSVDPIRGKIPMGEDREIIESSLRCGRDEALKLRERYGAVSAAEIGDKLGIAVEHKDEQSALDFVYVGLFESPNKITIYNNNIEKAASLLEALDITELNTDLKDIVLAHEMFHFIEEHDPNLYSNTRTIDLWSVGKLYTHRSKLICTGEIAAMSFAKALLGLSFDPNILDYIFLAAFDFNKTDQLFKKMINGRS